MTMVPPCARSAKLPQTKWRRLLAIDLGLFNVAIFFFAYLPPETLIFPEMVVMAMSVFCLIGVFAHSCERFSLPLEEWSYLLTGTVGMMTLFAYFSLDDSAYNVQVPFELFLLSGIASAYAAHVIDGGKREGRG